MQTARRVSPEPPGTPPVCSPSHNPTPLSRLSSHYRPPCLWSPPSSSFKMPLPRLFVPPGMLLLVLSDERELQRLLDPLPLPLPAATRRHRCRLHGTAQRCSRCRSALGRDPGRGLVLSNGALNTATLYTLPGEAHSIHTQSIAVE